MKRLHLVTHNKENIDRKLHVNVHAIITLYVIEGLQ